MLRVKLLHSDAKVPTRANPTDAGLDLHCFDEFGCVIGPFGKRAVISTGVSMAIPKGWAGKIEPRSGLAAKHGIDVLGGRIDSDYRGEIKVILVNHGDEYFNIHFGDRIAQLVIQKVELWTPEVVDELDETERGENGFGSSGK